MQRRSDEMKNENMIEIILMLIGLILLLLVFRNQIVECLRAIVRGLGAVPVR